MFTKTKCSKCSNISDCYTYQTKLDVLGYVCKSCYNDGTSNSTCNQCNVESQCFDYYEESELKHICMTCYKRANLRDPFKRQKNLKIEPDGRFQLLYILLTIIILFVSIYII